MSNKLNTIEDCLEELAGNTSFEIQNSDKTIMYSIARQVLQGKALTDRQFALMQTKLYTYKDQFLNKEFTNFDLALETLRMPLRHIDRSKYIKIVDDEIKIRFPFSKKDIIKVNEMPRVKYRHEKGTHEHYFPLTEQSIDAACSRFGNSTFSIDKKLLDWYEEIKVIKDNPSKYTPGLWNNNIQNLSSKARTYTENLSRLQLLDRKRQLGIEYITCEKDNTIENIIAQRSHPEVCLDPANYSLTEIISGLKKLERLPMLVLISPTNSLHELRSFINAFEQNGFDLKNQTVLFRNAKTDEYNVNDFIKDKKINNWLDKTTEVVYISKNKLPKLLLKNNWLPQAVVSLDSVRSHSKVRYYVDELCDLIVYNDDSPSIFANRWSSHDFV